MEAPGAPAPSDADRRESLRLSRESIRLIAQGNWPKAETAIGQALKRVPDDPINLYNLACVRARQGRSGPAMDALEGAAAAGFTDFVLIGRDPDLDALRGQPRFRALVAQKDQWQRRAAERSVEKLRTRFGEDYLYSVDFDQKLIFATNVDEQTLEELKALLKTQAVSQHGELFDHKPDAFITVVVPSAKDYRKIMRLRNVGGVYFDGSKTLVAQRLGEVMQHEFTHALHAADRAPLGQDHAAWVAEGLGVMYEWTRLRDDVLEPRGDNPRFPVAQAAARRRSLIPLDRLITMSPSEFLTRPNLTYPQSGALMYYLRERGLLKRFYDAYKETCDTDSSGAAALKKATGQDLAEFEGAWKQWLLDRAADDDAADPRAGNAWFLGVRLKPTRDGLVIAGVPEGGPAEEAGLRAGDLVVSVNGRAVRDYSGVRPAVGPYAPGRPITIRVRREGGEVDVRLTHAPPERSQEPAPVR